MLKSPWDYSAAFGTNNFSIWLHERLKTPHFYDFEILEPRNQYYLSLETPGYLTYLSLQEKTRIYFGKILVLEISDFRNPKFGKMEKTGAGKS